MRALYREEASRLHADRLHLIRSTGADLLDLATDEPYLPQLLAFFDRRERRRFV